MNIEIKHGGVMKRFLILFIVVWTLRAFATINGLVEFVNTLPFLEALNAKIIVINSQRSFPYYLLYPKGIK